MGNQLGTTTIAPSTTLTATNQQETLPTTFSMDHLLLSYQKALDTDPQLRQFDSDLHLRTNRAIDALSVSANQPLPFSLDLLQEVTGCLLDSNQQVVDLVLASQKDIWKNPQLFSLVDDYFKTSLHTLDFFTSLQRFLTTAKLKQAILRSALQRLASEEGQEREGYKKAMEDLTRFRSEDTTTYFTEEVLELFGKVYSENLSMLGRLEAERLNLDRRLKKIRTWKKTASVIFAVTVVTVLVCSIAAAAITAPPVVTAIVTALGAAAAWAPTETWFVLLWKKFESAVEEQREVVSSVQAGTLVALRDLDNIKVSVEALDAELASLVDELDGGGGDGSGVTLVIEEIERKVEVFSKNVEDLGEYVDGCSRNIHKARSVVLQRIMKPKP